MRERRGRERARAGGPRGLALLGRVRKEAGRGRGKRGAHAGGPRIWLGQAREGEGIAGPCYQFCFFFQKFEIVTVFVYFVMKFLELQNY